MCYDAKSSIRSYIIGNISSLILLFFTDNNELKAIGLVFLFIIHIQLLEYFIWNDQACKGLNLFSTYLINILLSFHVLIIPLSVYLFNITSYFSDSTLNAIILFQIVYFLIMIFIKTFFMIYKCTRPNKNNDGLEWDYRLNTNNKILSFIYILVHSFIYLLLAATFYLFHYNIFGLITSIGLFITFFYNRIKHNKIFGSFESNWCFVSAYIPLILVTYYFIDKYYLNNSINLTHNTFKMSRIF